ncbi:hypothetical protein HY993_00025 [Candidatus Micrarchaeota archaeon]|nr:hypothetical protein [Candidatus Micrarchaeota archaeon]
MFEKIMNEIRHNHFAMMAVCCIAPIIAIFVMQAAGIKGGIVYVIAIALCIGAHALMMGMGGGHEKHAGDEKKQEQDGKEERSEHASCH